MPTKRTPKPKQTTFDLELQVQDYLQNRSMRERSSGRENNLKGAFMALLEKSGILQSGGHRVLMLNDPLPYTEYKGGKTKVRSIAGIRRMRRASTSLNPDRTMAFLRKRKLVDACTVQVTEINEDAILAAAFEGKISDEDLKSLYDESETFAFYLVDDGATDGDDE